MTIKGALWQFGKKFVTNTLENEFFNKNDTLRQTYFQTKNEIQSNKQKADFENLINRFERSNSFTQENIRPTVGLLTRSLASQDADIRKIIYTPSMIKDVRITPLRLNDVSTISPLLEKNFRDITNQFNIITKVLTDKTEESRKLEKSLNDKIYNSFREEAQNKTNIAKQLDGQVASINMEVRQFSNRLNVQDIEIENIRKDVSLTKREIEKLQSQGFLGARSSLLGGPEQQTPAAPKKEDKGILETITDALTGALQTPAGQAGAATGGVVVASKFALLKTLGALGLGAVATYKLKQFFDKQFGIVDEEGNNKNQKLFDDLIKQRDAKKGTEALTGTDDKSKEIFLRIQSMKIELDKNYEIQSSQDIIFKAKRMVIDADEVIYKNAKPKTEDGNVPAGGGDKAAGGGTSAPTDIKPPFMDIKKEKATKQPYISHEKPMTTWERMKSLFSGGDFVGGLLGRSGGIGGAGGGPIGRGGARHGGGPLPGGTVSGGKPVASLDKPFEGGAAGAHRVKGVDKLLVESIQQGAIRAFGDPSNPDTRYVVDMQGGVASRRGRSKHPIGHAVDLQIYDRVEKRFIGGAGDIMKDAFGNAETYRKYEILSQGRYQYLLEKYGPDVANRMSTGSRFVSPHSGTNRQYAGAGQSSDAMHQSWDESQSLGKITQPASEKIQNWLDQYGAERSEGMGDDPLKWKSPLRTGAQTPAVPPPADNSAKALLERAKQTDKGTLKSTEEANKRSSGGPTAKEIFKQNEGSKGNQDILEKIRKSNESSGKPIPDAAPGDAEWSSSKGSWFGQYGYGRYKTESSKNVWRDTGDNGQNASGLPQTVPGIALPGRSTLGQYFVVEGPDGRQIVAQHVDIGPAKFTGRGVDINAPLAEALGYTPNNFPTDAQFKWKPLGKELPKGFSLGSPPPGPTGQPIGPTGPGPGGGFAMKDRGLTSFASMFKKTLGDHQAQMEWYNPLNTGQTYKAPQPLNPRGASGRGLPEKAAPPPLTGPLAGMSAMAGKLPGTTPNPRQGEKMPMWDKTKNPPLTGPLAGMSAMAGKLPGTTTPGVGRTSTRDKNPIQDRVKNLSAYEGSKAARGGAEIGGGIPGREVKGKRLSREESAAEAKDIMTKGNKGVDTRGDTNIQNPRHNTPYDSNPPAPGDDGTGNYDTSCFV